MIFEVHARTGAVLPSLGLGTWGMGENESARAEEIAALGLGLDLGMTLIDTAEMYADGGAEDVVADAISGRRDEVFVVSKVLPQHASYRGTLTACEQSLKRLRTDRIDLYLLHWPGGHPLEETLRAFAELVESGKIRYYGVSNFDVDELARAERLPAGSGTSVNQVLYNLGRRGIERNLIPWCSSRKIAVMAYSPLEQGRLKSSQPLLEVAGRHGATRAQVALAWTMRWDHVVTLVKAVHPEHVRENARAADIVLSEEDLRELDAAFPVPKKDVPLETL